MNWGLLVLIGSALGFSKAVSNSGLAEYAAVAIRKSGMGAPASVYVLFGFTMVRDRNGEVFGPPQGVCVFYPSYCCKNHATLILIPISVSSKSGFRFEVVRVTHPRSPMLETRRYSFVQLCTELISNNAAAALNIPVALSMAKEMEVRTWGPLYQSLRLELIGRKLGETRAICGCWKTAQIPVFLASSFRNMYFVVRLPGAPSRLLHLGCHHDHPAPV